MENKKNYWKPAFWIMFVLFILLLVIAGQLYADAMEEGLELAQDYCELGNDVIDYANGLTITINEAKVYTEDLEMLDSLECYWEVEA